MIFSYLFLATLMMVTLPAHSEMSANIVRPPNNVLAYAKGRLLVKLGHRVTPIMMEEMEKAFNAKRIYSYSLVEGLHLYQLNEDANIEEARQDFLNTGAVIYAEPDYIYYSQEILDAEYPKLWSFENTGQTGGTIDADINAEKMWAIESGSKSVVVGIIDTGIDYTHADLIENVWRNTKEIPGNNKDDDENGYVDDVSGINVIVNNGDPMDDNRHGTHVAGTIAASPNTIGVRGVAYGARVAACKFLSSFGSGSVSDAVKCMEYFAKLKSRAQDPVNIVATNNSWGGGAASDAMLDAIKAHERLGILFIAAAGNSSENNDVVDRYPCGYKVPNVLSVAATDNNDQLASFSSYGKRTVHVGAPGVKILSTILDQGYGELSGTSMATPHVAGLAAVIASHYPNHDYVRIKNLIMAGGQITRGTRTTTISGRRIRGADVNGTGSLTCSNQLMSARISPLGGSQRIVLGQDLLLSSTGVDCSEAAHSIILFERNGQKVLLKDNGALGDAKAKDGIYSVRWRPEAVGEYQLDFGQGDVLNISVYNPSIAKTPEALVE